jgi:hypothetical protein
MHLLFLTLDPPNKEGVDGWSLNLRVTLEMT